MTVSDDRKRADRMKPRVFISSVMDGYSDKRLSARAAVEAAGGEPVMAEDFPAGASSPRNACLDGVASADACVVIVGNRGGWTAPSGKLVVEEEYEEAVLRNLLLAVYIEETARDVPGDELATRLSDYVNGHFRATFRTSDELYDVMVKQLPGLLRPLRLPMTELKELTDRLSQPYEVQHQTTARLVVAPERNEEVIDRVTIGRAEFEESVLALGHTLPSKVFDYRASKDADVKNDSLVIVESAVVRRHAAPTTRLEITPEGIVTIDKIVSPDDNDDPLEHMEMFFIVRSEVDRALASMFAFVGQLFDSIDRFQRHQRFTYGVSFAGIGFRSLVDHVEKRSSYSMASNIDGPVLVEKPRIITRNVLRQPAEEIRRIITLLERRIKDGTTW